MSDVLDIAWIGTLLLPFVAAAVVALLAWRAGFGGAGLAVALGVLAGFLAGQVAVSGVPMLPPQGAIDKLPWLALGGGLAGLASTWLGARDARAVLVAAVAALAVAWLGWPRLGVPDAGAWVAAALVWAAASYALVRLETAGGSGGALLLVIAAFATAGVAFYGSSYRMAQLVAVLAAAIGGAMAGAGGFGPGLGAAGRLAAALPLTGLIAILALYTSAEPLALALLLPIFLADAARIRVGVAGRANGGARLLVLAVFALIPAVAAVAVALWRGGPLYF